MRVNNLKEDMGSHRRDRLIGRREIIRAEEAEQTPRREGQLGASPPDKSGLNTINRLLRLGETCFC
jgi:hypothetical protein